MAGLFECSSEVRGVFSNAENSKKELYTQLRDLRIKVKQYAIAATSSPCWSSSCSSIVILKAKCLWCPNHLWQFSINRIRLDFKNLAYSPAGLEKASWLATLVRHGMQSPCHPTWKAHFKIFSSLLLRQRYLPCYADIIESRQRRPRILRRQPLRRLLWSQGEALRKISCLSYKPNVKAHHLYDAALILCKVEHRDLRPWLQCVQNF